MIDNGDAMDFKKVELELDAFYSLMAERSTTAREGSYSLEANDLWRKGLIESSASAFEGSLDKVMTLTQRALDDISQCIAPPIDIQDPLGPKIGQKAKRPKNPLMDFIDTPKPSKKKNSEPANKPREHPKMEYYRIKLLRGQKRAIRGVYANRVPKTTINEVDMSNEEQATAWNVFCAYTLNQKVHLNRICSPASGPLTDGESHHQANHGKEFKKLLSNSNERTFNNNFCSRYFQDIATRDSFIFYIDVLFMGRTPQMLCKKFNFKCCNNSIHDDLCIEKWNNLKEYTKSILIRGKNCNSENDQYGDEENEIEVEYLLEQDALDN